MPRIVTKVSGFFDWVDLPPEVKVTAQDIASGRVKPGRGYTEASPRWQALKEFKTPSENTLLIIERDLVDRVIGEYTKEGKQRRIVTRHQAIVEHIRKHAINDAAQFGEQHMLDVAVYDEGPHEELFDEVMTAHLAADHGKAEGKNVDAEDAAKIKAAYMTPAESSDDHGVRAEGPSVYPADKLASDGSPHALAGKPHHGLAHAQGVRSHLLSSFRLRKK